MRQIIAIGGGGFGREIGELKIERYIKEQAKTKNPKICFIPTATGDDSGYIENFYSAFNSLECVTSHIDFFKRTIGMGYFMNLFHAWRVAFILIIHGLFPYIWEWKASELICEQNNTN